MASRLLYDEKPPQGFHKKKFNKRISLFTGEAINTSAKIEKFYPEASFY